MASFNTNHHHHSAAADVLSSSLAAGGSNTQHNQHHQHHYSSHLPPPPASHSLHHSHHPTQQHFERSSSSSSSSTTSTTYLVPVTSSHLPLDSTAFLSASPHFVTSNPVSLSSHSASNTSSSYTFVQIKREPCQVSEVTTSNTNNHHHTIGSIAAASSASSSLSSLAASSASGSLAAAKTMSSTLTTLVKIEASSPKVHEMDKTHLNAHVGGGGGGNLVHSSNNTVPIGIAVARKRPQETTAPPPHAPPSLTSSSTLPLSQSLNKDMNCFGIRVADLGGVGTGCGNIYFTGNGDLMTSSAADELALANAASLQSVNRAPSTFWQYSNALPIESVISMSPATVGLQYSRDSSRGQVVLLPATATPLDPFQQAAAAAFVWPSYIPQGTASATLQPPPNFIFPSMSPHSTLQAAAAAQPYATSLQLLGSNYLTAAAAAAAAAAASSTLCQHNQQTNSTNSSINLSLGGSVSGSSSGTTMSSSSSSTTTRFMSLATTGGGGASSINDTGQSKNSLHKALAPVSVPLPPPPTLALATNQSLITSAHHQHSHSVPPPLLIPPSALKMEEWSSTDYMTGASKTTTTLAAAALSVPQLQPPPAHFDHRDKSSALATTHSATNLLGLSAPNTQALNLMRLPTPPASATMNSAAVAAAASAAGTPNHLQTQLLFQTASSSPTPSLLNLSATLNRVTATQTSQNSPNVTTSLTSLAATSSPLNNMSNSYLNCSPANGATLTTTIGPPTPMTDDMPALHFKASSQQLDTSTSPQVVVGVPRVVHQALPNSMPSSQAQPPPAPPQMQDVNIQTDTPVCSEDENSSCPLNPTTTSTQVTAGGGSVNSANNTTNTEQCTTAQCTPPLTQNDELYHDTEAQQPLELTKSAAATNGHRAETPLVESSSQLQTEELTSLVKSPIKQQPSAYLNEVYREDKKCEDHPAAPHDHLPMSLTPTITSSTATPHPNPEDLTGLELLSNISTSTLAKPVTIRVKQEPVEAVNESTLCHLAASEHHTVMEMSSGHLQPHHTEQQNSLISHAENLPTPLSPQSHTTSIAQHHVMSSHSPMPNLAPSEEVEPLGGLKLLCALAEQRIHEEEEVQSTSLNATNGLFRSSTANSPHNFNCSSFAQHAFVKPNCSSSAPNSFPPLDMQNSSFPSLETLELPSTSTTGTIFAAHISESAAETPIKRKKHKHSKHSSKSSSSLNGLSSAVGGSGGGGGGGSSSKKSQKCSKKNKKKYSKEKKRHRLLAEAQQTDLDFDDPQLQQELQNAFQNCVDPNYQHKGKWPTPQEIFSIMENSMRMRLADITRQYRKKKRKLDEISKNKKNKKKCSKLQANQQISLVGNTALSLAASERSSTTTVVGPTALSSSPLCDYKFGKFSTATPSSSATTPSNNYLAPSSFIRFATETTKSQNHHHHHHHHHLNTHPQFPPPPDLELDNENTTSSNTPANGTTATLIYKPVRLEPSSLDQRSITAPHSVGAASSGGSNGILRLAQKHASSEKHLHVIACKEPKLSNSISSRHSSGNEDIDDIEEDEEMAKDNVNENEMHDESHHNRCSSDIEMSKQVCVAKPRKMNPIDRSLMLTHDHLYRNETRVLTDMGGLFYAGIMKPLQPPDVYAITLDGERGNKSHIMSREEIFKDTILELAPKTVEDVAVGTRLCAYWSQQYRCLYPGRAIESESSDDGVTSQEFVSVEFDDGDSGRIRLQNIRLLLSDYPQVEYNDNPLYSLGKHKKSSGNKISSNNDSDHHQHSHGDDDAEASDDGTTSRVAKNGSSRDYHQATAMEIFAAKRSEKKRNKSLKKKAQAQSNSNSSMASGKGGASSSPGDSGGINGSLESNADYGRKHHKHKKRKKHKKHRKNLMEIGIVSEMDNESYKALSSTSYTKKTERTTHSAAVEQQHHASSNVNVSHALAAAEENQQQDEREAEDEAEEEENFDDEHNTQTEDSQMAEDSNINVYRIKQESNGLTCTSNGMLQNSTNIKVKTEHLDLEEEESTSNLMSEISDEAKLDDIVEHNSSKGSKIAAFLPERQLWGWLGTAYCKFGNKGTKGRIRKQFYKTIKRGKETITVGECAVFLSTGRPDRPYIGRIESMWENSCNNKIVRVRWFYHPEETTGCPNLKYPGALFESPHEDENDVQTISHRCEVLQFGRYYNKFGSDSKQYQSIYDNNDTYYLAGYYNPRLQVLKLQDNIPTLEEQQQQQQQQPLNTTIILNKDLITNASATHKTNTTTTTNNSNSDSNLNNTNTNTN